MIGFWAFKKDIIDSVTSKKLSSIVVNIANPAMILSGVIGDTSQIQGKDLMITITASIVLYLVLLVIGTILPKFLHIPKKSEGTYSVMTVFSNIGFIILIGTANPIPSALLILTELIPISFPFVSINAPPLFPSLMVASVWIKSVI